MFYLCLLETSQIITERLLLLNIVTHLALLAFGIFHHESESGIAGNMAEKRLLGP